MTSFHICHNLTSPHLTSNSLPPFYNYIARSYTIQCSYHTPLPPFLPNPKSEMASLSSNTDILA